MVKDVGPSPRPWGRGRGLGGVAKVLGGGKAVGAWPTPWGHGQGVEGVTKSWGPDQHRGGVAKALGE